MPEQPPGEMSSPQHETGPHLGPSTPNRSRMCSASTLLQLTEQCPPKGPDGPTLGLVDLFSGCGPFTLGAAAAASQFGLKPQVALAVDIDRAASEVFKANFPSARVMTAPVESLFDGELGAPLTETECATRRMVGATHVVLGGPPCQGHSDLNNHTRRNDPRNSLYARMARAIEVLEPDIGIIENVPTVVHSAEGVVDAACNALDDAGYTTATGKVDLSALGVPQRRRRHVLIAAGRSSGVDARTVIDEVLGTSQAARAVGWALGDLVERANGGTPFDTPTTLSATNAERIRWLFDNDMYDLPNELRPACHQGNHSYVSMYGRLRWDEPAQTITTGFGSMGQGRYVHPNEPRMLTAHEAARLQGIPDYFRFEAAINRTTMRRLIGNAVPPALSETIIRTVLGHLANP